MERERFQAYVASLEQILMNTHFDLTDAMKQLQDLCVRVTPERIVPMGIITENVLHEMGEGEVRILSI